MTADRGVKSREPAMECQRGSLLLICYLLCFVTASQVLSTGHEPAFELERSGFPSGFLFGASSAAYQYEGAASAGGRGPSIWDTFAHNHPERIADRSNGDVAIDSYHRYKEDVSIMKNMGLDAFRFSISWSRILPNGSVSGGINNEGVDYYNKFIDELVSNGLQPFVTLIHFDPPQGLEDKYGGFLSPNIVKDFRDYAGICFREFGDRVKHWITINEPWSFSVDGYASGIVAPGRCSPWESTKCDAGDSGREPYIVAHNQLLAHAAAVKLYRDKYKTSQKGKIGITVGSNWMLSYSDSEADKDAVDRAMDFVYGWFMDPLTHGDYPLCMKALVGSRLPKFTEAESKLVLGTFDFIGLNYYSANYIQSLTMFNGRNKSYNSDICVNPTEVRNGVPIGPRAASTWLYIYPRGIRDMLLYTKAKYGSPVIYITENGVDEVNNGTLSLEEALKDDTRIDFHRQHLYYVQRAIREGVDVRGYFAWSMLDNFEWMDGYTVRFGLNYVDYNHGLKRHPKKSALWFHKCLKT